MRVYRLGPPLVIVVGIILVLACGAWSQIVVTAVAGGGQPVLSDRALDLMLTLLDAVAVDANGNLFATLLGSSWPGPLVKITPDGVAKPIALGSLAAAATAVTIDKSGNVYVVLDVEMVSPVVYLRNFSTQVWKVATDGTVTVVAGSQTTGFSGDGGPAVKASLSQFPCGLAIDGFGNLYIADTLNHRIRKVAPDGLITTVAGNGVRAFSGDGGPATAASLAYPRGVAVDSAGALYIADEMNYRIRKVTADGKITTIAGPGVPGGQSPDDVPATQAQVYPHALAIDAVGAIYVADGNRISKISPTGILSKIAGADLGQSGFSGDGGPATAAWLAGPGSIAVDAAGNIYVADNGRIRRVTVNGIIDTVAGGGTSATRFLPGDGGPATMAWLLDPEGIAIDRGGNIYISDAGTHRVRKVDTLGIITTVAGNGKAGYGGDGGPGTLALLNEPRGLAIGPAGDLLIADTLNSRVRRLGAGGVITTVAGGGGWGDGGPATLALLFWPRSVAADSAGNVYIADTQNNRVRKVRADGTIVTVAGNGSAQDNDCPPCQPGQPCTTCLATTEYAGRPGVSAPLYKPSSLAIDAAGNLLIASPKLSEVPRSIPPPPPGIPATRAVSGPRYLLRLAPDGSIWQLADAPAFAYAGDVITRSCLFPATCDYSLATDPLGNLWIASLQPMLYVLAGQAATLQDRFGGLSTFAANQDTPDNACPWAGQALLYRRDPRGVDTMVWGPDGFSVAVAVDTSGNLYIADACGMYSSFNASRQSVVRKLTFPSGGPPQPLPASLVNGASAEPTPLVPGSIATLFGTNLTKGVTGIVAADRLPLPRELAGTAVTLDGNAAPLFAVANVNGQEQINFQVPWELAERQYSSLVVRNNGQASGPIDINTRESSPGIFTAAGKQGAILHGSTYEPVTASNPARGGEVVILYATGLGKIAPGVATGTAAVASPLSVVVSQPVVSVGGATAEVLFSGLAPGFVGLYQLNVRIPAGVGSGSAVPLAITQNGVVSNTVTIAID